MTRLFQHIRTHQVVEVPEIRPGVVNFNGVILQLEELSLHDWNLLDKDPGYRGIPGYKAR